MSPRILYLSPFWPGPPSSASELRSLEIARALADCGRVEFAVIGGPSPGSKGTSPGICEFDVSYDVSVHSTPNAGVAAKLSWLFDPRSRFPHGLAAEEPGACAVLERARRADLIWFFKLRTANLFSQWAWPRSVVDVDDVPSAFEQSVLNQSSGAARVATRLRAWSWRRREKLIGERFSGATVCSEADASYLRGLGVSAPITVVPNGFSAPTVEPTRHLAAPPRLGFIGVFDHAPNREGIRWFVSDCWPLIKQQIPDVRLRLVGRHSDGPAAPRGPDIDALGWLSDPSEEMSSWASMVVPVRTGAGTRGKIAHAFSRKCPVVSTQLGAYGYEPRHGFDMFLAETPGAFAEACVRTIREPTIAAAVAERAWQNFVNNWTWTAIKPRVWAAAQAGLAANRRSCAPAPPTLRTQRSR